MARCWRGWWQLSAWRFRRCELGKAQAKAARLQVIHFQRWNGGRALWQIPVSWHVPLFGLWRPRPFSSFSGAESANRGGAFIMNERSQVVAAFTGYRKGEMKSRHREAPSKHFPDL